LAHELWHSIRHEDGDAAARIAVVMEKYTAPALLDHAVRSSEQKYGPDAIQEVAANIFASAMVDPAFWIGRSDVLADSLRGVPGYTEAQLVTDWRAFRRDLQKVVFGEQQTRPAASEPRLTIRKSTVPWRPMPAMKKSLSSKQPHPDLLKLVKMRERNSESLRKMSQMPRMTLEEVKAQGKRTSRGPEDLLDS